VSSDTRADDRRRREYAAAISKHLVIPPRGGDTFLRQVALLAAEDEPPEPEAAARILSRRLGWPLRRDIWRRRLRGLAVLVMAALLIVGAVQQVTEWRRRAAYRSLYAPFTYHPVESCKIPEDNYGAPAVLVADGDDSAPPVAVFVGSDSGFVVPLPPSHPGYPEQSRSVSPVRTFRLPWDDSTICDVVAVELDGTPGAEAMVVLEESSSASLACLDPETGLASRAVPVVGLIDLIPLAQGGFCTLARAESTCVVQRWDLGQGGQFLVSGGPQSELDGVPLPGGGPGLMYLPWAGQERDVLLVATARHDGESPLVEAHALNPRTMEIWWSARVRRDWTRLEVTDLDGDGRTEVLGWRAGRLEAYRFTEQGYLHPLWECATGMPAGSSLTVSKVSGEILLLHAGEARYAVISGEGRMMGGGELPACPGVTPYSAAAAFHRVPGAWGVALTSSQGSVVYDLRPAGASAAYREPRWQRLWMGLDFSRALLSHARDVDGDGRQEGLTTMGDVFEFAGSELTWNRREAISSGGVEVDFGADGLADCIARLRPGELRVDYPAGSGEGQSISLSPDINPESASLWVVPAASLGMGEHGNLLVVAGWCGSGCNLADGATVQIFSPVNGRLAQVASLALRIRGRTGQWTGPPAVLPYPGKGAFSSPGLHVIGPCWMAPGGDDGGYPCLVRWWISGGKAGEAKLDLAGRSLPAHPYLVRGPGGQFALIGVDCSSGGPVAILLRTEGPGDLVWQRVVLSEHISPPQALVAADVDGDGRHELLVQDSDRLLHLLHAETLPPAGL